MRWFILLSLSVVELTYIVIGGLIFHYLESYGEQQTIQDSDNITTSFAASHQCVSEADVDKLVDSVLESRCSGMGYRSTARAPNWDIYSAIFFTTVVITTIGYGNIAPRTVGGQMFCIMYAMIGIPFHLVLLADVGVKQKDLVIRLTDRMINKRFEKFPVVVGIVRVAFTLILGQALFILAPAVIFKFVEGWPYGTGVYYGFVSLCTIGFGDYVAGVNSDISYRGWYRLSVSCWILVGIMWLSGVISILQSIFSSLTDNIDNKIGVQSHAPSSHTTSNSIASSNSTDTVRITDAYETKATNVQNLANKEVISGR